MSSTLESFEEAEKCLGCLDNLVKTIFAETGRDNSQNEEQFDAKVKPLVDEAATRSQELASYFQANKRMKQDPEFKRLHRDFVTIMKEFQSAHNQVSSRREAICDQVVMQNVTISAADLELAKEQESKAIDIAETAVEVKHLYQEVKQNLPQKQV